MTQLIEHIAELTGFRDREQLDVSIVRAIHDVLRPIGVCLYRSFGEPGDERWLTRARIGAGQRMPTADPLWIDVAALPPLATVPSRHDCLRLGEVVTAGEGPHITHFPISTEREVIGVLEVETRLPLASANRALVVTVLRIYGNFHDLLDYSERDPLTGLLNRQTFDSAFMNRTYRPVAASDSPDPDVRAPASEGTVWLGVIDIDNFKQVNDNHGHLIGDEVLLLVSRLLRACFRFQDRLYRFGGEEFVTLIDCATAGQAAQAFERLRGLVEKFEFPQAGHITVSIGFTQTVPMDAPSAAFARADRALYHAKGSGRNQVWDFDELVRNGLADGTGFSGAVTLF